jgi:hypothetical protein
LTIAAASAAARRRNVIVGTGTIALSQVAARRVYQRIGAASPVPLSGSYTGTPTAVEARVIDSATFAVVQDWAVAAPSPSGGTWSGSISVPQGGWYKIQVRFLNAGQIVTGTTQWGVGDVWVFAGAAQQRRMSTAVDAPPTPDDRTAVFDGAAWALPGVLANSSGNGVIRFLNLMAAATGVPQAVLQTATDSASIADWEAADPAYTAAASALTSLGRVGAILWHQGSGDIGLLTRAQYKIRLADLRTRLESAATVQRFGLFPLMRRTADPTDAVHDLRRAHFEYIAENPGTVNLGWTPTVALADASNQTPAGSETIAHAYAHALLYATGTEPRPNLGPVIAGVSRSGRTLTLSVQHRAGTALALSSGTQPSDFKVFAKGAAYSDAGGLAISSMAIGASTITIQLATDPGTDVDVYYQYGRFDGTSAILDNVTALGRTTGNAMLPLMDPVNAPATTTPPVDPVTPGIQTSALRFDGLTGCVTYADSALWDFPDADWTLGVWVSVADNTGAAAQYVVSVGGYTANHSVNLIIHESAAARPHAIEANVRGAGASAYQAIGLTDASLTTAAWRLWTVERIKATEILNIYQTPLKGARTLYFSRSVAGLGAIQPTEAPVLATRAPPTSGSARWLDGSLASFFKMNGTLSAAETQAIASGQDIVSDLGRTPLIYTRLNTLSVPIANSGTGGSAPASLTGTVALAAGPTF